MSYDLEKLLRAARTLASTPLNQLEVDSAAGVALALAACRDAIDEHLDPLKEVLRKDARHDLEAGELSEEVIIEYDGQLDGDNWKGDQEAGVVSVSFQPSRVRVQKGTRESTLRRVLGAEFDLYFELNTQVQARRDFKERCRQRQGEHPTEVAAAMSSVELFEPTPRVGFRPLLPVRPLHGGAS